MARIHDAVRAGKIMYMPEWREISPEISDIYRTYRHEVLGYRDEVSGYSKSYLGTSSTCDAIWTAIREHTAEKVKAAIMEYASYVKENKIEHDNIFSAGKLMRRKKIKALLDGGKVYEDGKTKRGIMHKAEGLDNRAEEDATPERKAEFKLVKPKEQSIQKQIMTTIEPREVDVLIKIVPVTTYSEYKAYVEKYGIVTMCAKTKESAIAAIRDMAQKLGSSAYCLLES